MQHNEESIVRLLQEHCAHRAGLQLRDMVKLIYQNEHGCGHLISDPGESLERLRGEYNSLRESSDELFEEIGNGLCRLNLGAMGDGDVSLETVNGFAVYTARTVVGSREGLLLKLRILGACCKDGLLPFDHREAEAFLEDYISSGCPAVGHSQQYREVYSPAYRVVRREFMTYYPLFCRIDALMKEKSRTTVAIDGVCGSGKSTLGELVREVYGCNLFHMDDFFLPLPRKTPERLAETGGNVDYERFRSEVLQGLATGRRFSYRVYDCASRTMAESVRVTPARLNLVEGVYSLHPTLRDFYDLRVFLRISREEQHRRILARSGPRLLERFIGEWIPLEDRYFEEMEVQKRCELVFENDRC